LSGHDALYERILTNDLVYFVNALSGDQRYPILTLTAGSQIQFNEEFGAMRIEASQTNIVFQFITVSNRIIDSYTLTAPPQPPIGPTILCQSRDQTVRLGTNITFSVTAKGVGMLRYQWRFNDNEIPGATDEVFVLNNVQRSDQGTYQVIISDDIGSLASDPMVLTLILNPVIVTQPQDQTVNQGTSVSFNVIAQGYDPIHYQWQHSGTNLPNATNQFLSISNAQSFHEGLYRVQIFDDVGSTFSQAATLTVRLKPVIIQQPLSISAVEGEDVTFSIAVASTAPMGYRWRFGGLTLTNILLDQTSCFFTIRNVQSTNAGTYTVAVTNLAGPAPLSSSAVLTILSDRDHDGVPDAWESANGFDPDDSADAGLDKDGDELTNRQEYQAGTDPNSSESKLRFESIQADSALAAVRISFLALSNRTYAVESTDNAAGPWNRVAEFVATSTNRTVEVVDGLDPNKPQKLYRLLTPVLR